MGDDIKVRSFKEGTGEGYLLIKYKWPRFRLGYLGSYRLKLVKDTDTMVVFTGSIHTKPRKDGGKTGLSEPLIKKAIGVLQQEANQTRKTVFHYVKLHTALSQERLHRIFVARNEYRKFESFLLHHDYRHEFPTDNAYYRKYEPQ